MFATLRAACALQSVAGMKPLVVVAILMAVSACLDAPLEADAQPAARVVVAWDPLPCGDDPHRVAVELEDEAGYPASSSTWCATGSVTLDVRQLGIYRGRVYAWARGEVRAELPMRLTVDAPITRWFIPTPR